MTETNLNPEGQPTEVDTQGTDSRASGLSLEDLNKALGKDFKDAESALKSLKDTQDFVGEKGQKLKEAEEKLANAEVGSKEATELAKKVEALEKQAKEAQFFADNPDMNNPQTRKLLEKFGDPYEAINNEDFKSINDPILAYNKANQSRSIIHKNSRLGQVTNKIDESKQSLDDAYNKAGSGDQVGAMTAYNKAKSSAVDAVLDAVERKK